MSSVSSLSSPTLFVVVPVDGEWNPSSSVEDLIANLATRVSVKRVNSSPAFALISVVKSDDEHTLLARCGYIEGNLFVSSLEDVVQGRYLNEDDDENTVYEGNLLESVVDRVYDRVLNTTARGVALGEHVSNRYKVGDLARAAQETTRAFVHDASSLVREKMQCASEMISKMTDQAKEVAKRVDVLDLGGKLSSLASDAWDISKAIVENLVETAKGSSVYKATELKAKDLYTDASSKLESSLTKVAGEFDQKRKVAKVRIYLSSIRDFLVSNADRLDEVAQVPSEPMDKFTDEEDTEFDKENSSSTDVSESSVAAPPCNQNLLVSEDQPEGNLVIQEE